MSKLSSGLKNGPPLVLDAVRGSAVSALLLVVYDTLLVLDREVKTVWRSKWSLSKGLYLFVRYHSIVALSWYLMQAVGDTPFRLNYRPLGRPPPPATTRPGAITSCHTNLKFSQAGRWYVGMTELFTMLLGEALILLRINALYGWSRGWVILTLFLFFGEATVGFVTTIMTLLGGTRLLAGSSNVLDCSAGSFNLSDVNIGMWIASFAVACIYLYLLMRKAAEFSQVALQGRRFPLFSFLWSSNLAPTLHLCCRDGAIYFLSITSIILVNLVLSVLQSDYSVVGTSWIICIYTIASTRIFLNLKEGPKRDDSLHISSGFARESSESTARFATTNSSIQSV